MEVAKRLRPSSMVGPVGGARPPWAGRQVGSRLKQLVGSVLERDAQFLAHGAVQVESFAEGVDTDRSLPTPA